MNTSQKTIRNITDLLKHVSTRVNNTKNPIWFRGHARKNWSLIPSLYRDNKKTEMDYIKEFKQRATLLVEEPRPKAYHEWLFIMRHYRIPSRLLDWTESPLVGLFFAVYQNINEDGVLWALRPLKLNRNVPDYEDDGSLPSFDENEDFLEDYTLESILANPTPKAPLAIIAPRNSNRMQVQLSVFTINQNNNKPIDKVGDGTHVWKYIIPKNAKEKLRKELDILKITYFQLFPELIPASDTIRGKPHED